MKRMIQKRCFLAICLMSIFILNIPGKISAQQSININNPDKSIAAFSLKSGKSNPVFKDAERYREFSLNPRLRSSSIYSKGDTLLLDFFEDKKYTAVVEKVSLGIDGITGITSRITDSQYAYCFMTVSDNGISMTAELPQEDEQFFIAGINDKVYLSEFKMSALANKIKPCGGAFSHNENHENDDEHLHVNELHHKTENGKTANEESQFLLRNTQNAQPTLRSSNSSCTDMDNEITLNVMIVYTAKAENWCRDDYEVTDINDAINIVIQKANLVMANSRTGVTFNLVHKYRTTYNAINDIADLYRLEGKNDGYMDDVHTLRDQYQADLISLFADVDFTGGVASLLTTEEGSRDYCSFSLNRVQQVSSTYTVIHEWGHNMGCEHNKDQELEPGSGAASLFGHSNGWKGMAGGQRVCTVMSYEDGYADGKRYTTIPYFSDPENSYNGTAIGGTLENNATTIKKTKYVTSKYRSGERLDIYLLSYYKFFGEADPEFNQYIIMGDGILLEGDEIVQFREEEGEDVGDYAVSAYISRNGNDVTCEYFHSITGTTLTISKEYFPSITAPALSYDYDGDPVAVASDITLVPSIAEKTITYQGTLLNGTAYPLTTAAPHQAGNYTYTVTIVENDNHSSATQTATLTILKATPAISLTSKTAEYTGSPIAIDTPILTGGTAAADLIGGLTIQYDGIEGTSYSSSTPPTAVGKYRVTVGTSGDNNHNAASATTELTITEKQKITPEITFDDQSINYTGSAVTVTFQIVPDDAPFTITYQGTLKNGTAYPQTTVAPHQAGDYTCTVTVTENEDYLSATKTATLTISKATPAISLTSKTAEYTGSPIAIDTPVLTGGTAAADLIGGLTIQYDGIEGTSYSSSTPPTAVGKYRVTVGTPGDNNHNAASATTELTITEKQKITPEITFDDQSINYTGSAVSVTFQIVPDDAPFTITYQGTGTTDYPESTDAPINPGTYLVKIEVPGTSTYNSVSKTATLVIASPSENTSVRGVTIGALSPPQEYSVLELVSNQKSGMRLPQLTTGDREAMEQTDEFKREKNDKARGLIIFNTTTNCVEFWNGTKWISSCN